MGLKKRLERLEKALPSACPGCVTRRITWHHQYQLPTGEILVVPPVATFRPPCTRRPARMPSGIERFILHAVETASHDATKGRRVESDPYSTT